MATHPVDFVRRRGPKSKGSSFMTVLRRQRLLRMEGYSLGSAALVRTIVGLVPMAIPPGDRTSAPLSAQQLPDPDRDEIEGDERHGQGQHGEGIRTRGGHGGHHGDGDHGPAP